MMRRNKKIQFIILLTLVFLVSIMTVAYAVLSTTLNINGTAQVMDASWNVHFDNIQVNSGSVPISPKITDNDKITFSSDLTTPGQFYKFTVDIVNSGSIDAMIETVIKNPELTTEQKKYLRYEVEYLDGASINETQLLKANETKTISVLVSYRNDIPISDLPSTETNLDLEIRLVYVQATSLGTEISSNDTKVVRVVNGNIDTIGSEIAIGDEYFYLIGTDNNKAVLLAKYNLYAGGIYDGTRWNEYGEDATGIQNSSMLGYTSAGLPYKGGIAFSFNIYWLQQVNEYPSYVYNSNSGLYLSLENYKSYLEENNVVIDNIRLLMYEEALTLGCKEGSCASAPSWVYYSTYWTGSVASDSGDVWCITTTAEFKGSKYTNSDRGIRPVIEISKSYF